VRKFVSCIGEFIVRERREEGGDNVETASVDYLTICGGENAIAR
jgi:hypothetical protein